MERLLYPLHEGRALLGNPSRASLYRWEAQGIIKLTRIGGRVFIPAAEIERLAGHEEVA